MAFNTASTQRMVITQTGIVGIGTTSPFAKVSITDSSGTAQLAVAYDSTKYNTFQTDAATGDLILAGNTNNVRLNNGGSLYVCTGGSCPTGAPASGSIIAETSLGVGTSTPNWNVDISGTAPSLGISDQSAGSNLKHWLLSSSGGSFLIRRATDALAVTGNAFTITSSDKVGVGTTSPWAQFSIGSGGALVVAENTLATSTSMTIDWRNGNQQLVRIGTAATTISFNGYVAGQKLVLTVCNPNATAGALSWGTGILWSGGTAPTQTTTGNKCDIWSFLATQATSTLVIFGAQTSNF
jgi:hypothetical protein